MNAIYRSEEENDEYIHLGCYEIGTERLTATIIEQNFDADGIVWPLIGHIFKAGQKFSENMNAMYRSEEETDEYIHLGCYEIGTERLTATIIEQNFDADGIVWPLSVAPFEVEIIPVNLKNEDVVNTAERIYLDAMK